MTASSSFKQSVNDGGKKKKKKKAYESSKAVFLLYKCNTRGWWCGAQGE